MAGSQQTITTDHDEIRRVVVELASEYVETLSS
jgi:hypothetical protein